MDNKKEHVHALFLLPFSNYLISYLNISRNKFNKLQPDTSS